MKRFLMCLGAMACLSQVAHADPMDDLDAAQQKVFDAWQNVPFSQRAVLFETASSTGFGMYTDRKSNVFKPNEKIITYVEPVGYGWKDLPDNVFELNIVADLKLLSEHGDVLNEQKAFSTNDLKSHHANMEFSMDFTLSLTDVPAGKYKIEYTLHDVSTKQDSTFQQDIVIAE
jgi:hypothetical protein